MSESLCWGVHGRKCTVVRSDRAASPVRAHAHMHASFLRRWGPTRVIFFFSFSPLLCTASRTRSPPPFPQFILRPTAFHRLQRSRLQ